MKERPLIFTAESVRGILDGRKTQTRRVMPAVKHPNWTGYMAVTGGAIECGPDYPDDDSDFVKCPYGVPGDRLWVRETYSINSVDTGTASVGFKERLPLGATLADTDGGLNVIHLGRDDWTWAASHVDSEKWRNPLFMPRWASRLTLEITEVRVQRVQDISEEDAIAEGCQPEKITEQDVTDMQISDANPSVKAMARILGPGQFTAKFAYSSLWDSINANRGYPWSSNPWVWALTFRRVN